MKTIAIYNHKGGVGKSVTAVNFSYNLSAMGYRVLAVDLDPQGNTSSFFRRYDLNKPSIREVLTVEKPMEQCICRTKYPKLDIVQCNMNLRDLTAEMLEFGTEALSAPLDEIAGKYDYCIIDCPPRIDFLIEIIVAAVQDIIVPLTPDVFAAEGIGSVMDIVRTFGGGDVSAACLFTKFYRNKDTLNVIDEVICTSGIYVYENVIRRCSAVDHSIKTKKPLVKCASRSTAALDYMDFTEEYLKREVQDGEIN